MFSSVSKYLKEGVESASQTLQQNERLRNVINTLQPTSSSEADSSSTAAGIDANHDTTAPSAPIEPSSELAVVSSSPGHDQVADNSSTHSATTPLPKHLVPCAHCSTMINTSLLETVLKTAKPFHHCRICAQIFCLKCLSKSSIPIPNLILHDSYQSAKGAEDRQYLCLHQCMPLAVNICLQTFRHEMNDKFAGNFSVHIAQHAKHHRGLHSSTSELALDEYGNERYFPMPPLICEDNAYRRALRFAYIAEAVADLSGYTFAIKAMKYAYMSSELMNILVAGDLFSVLSPLLETLKGYGITGPTAILRIYYLGCIHTARLKENMIVSKAERYAADRRGVLMSRCPPHLLDYVSRFVSPAQWLYHAGLPKPHDSNEWSSWYLSNLIAKQNWTLLMNINATTKLPDGVKCPAFCIVSRVTKRRKAHLPAKKESDEVDEDEYEVCREAMLVIRGSKSTMDWAINLQEDLVEYSYWFKPTANGSSSVQQVMGFMHKGIYHGAMGILDGFMVRSFLLMLYNAGYDVQVVGHSLGAGVACVVAAELRNTITLSLYGSHTGEGGMLSTNSGMEEKREASQHLDASRISAVMFSCPSIVSENLAEAFQQDRLCVQVVHGADVIPRANHKTMQRLAEELIAAKITTDIYRVQDQCDLTNYVAAMGRANDIYTSSSASLNEERYQKLRLKSELEASKGKKSSADVIVVEDGDEVAETEAQPSSSNPLSSLSNNATVNAVLKEAEKGMKTVEETMRQLFRRPSVVSNNAAKTGDEVSVGPHDESQQEATYVEMASVTIATVTEVEAPPAKPSKPSKPTKPSRVAPVEVEVAEVMEPSAPSLVDINLDESVQQKQVVVMVENTEKKDFKIDHHQIRTVTPGPIIHIYRECDGSMQSSVISYDHEIFSELEVYPEQIISDHTMVTYRTMLTAAVFYCKRLALLQDGHEDEHRCDDLFPSHLQARFVSLSAADEAGNQHNYGLDKHKFDQKANTSTAIPLEHPSVVDSSSLPSKELSVCVPVEIDADLPSVEGKMTLEVEAVKSPASQCKWIPCAICHLDVTWPNVMHSDACRARTMHRCAACQRIVCVVCAPAGDQIAGDGMSQKHDLPNFSIALPHLGLFTPHRVCMHCYFDSSHPGL